MAISGFKSFEEQEDSFVLPKTAPVVEKPTGIHALELIPRDGQPDVFPNPWPSNQRWIEDLPNGNKKYHYYHSLTTLKGPKMGYCYGKVGGYAFTPKNQPQLLIETKGGIRGIGFEGVLIFDGEGNGVVLIARD